MLQDIDLKYSKGALTTTKPLAVPSLTVGGQAVAGGITAPAEAQPSDHGLTAWSYDPSLAVSTLSPTLGSVYLSALYLRQATTISKLWFLMGTAATTPTAGQNWAGLINSSGTVLSTAALDSIITTGNNPKNAALGTPQAVAAGAYWVALVFNAAAAPVLYKTGIPFAAFGTVNQTAASLRYAINGTSQTTLSNVTPSSNAAGQSIWVGAS